jgi:hypothetical protein
MNRVIFLALLTFSVTVMCFSYSQDDKAKPKKENQIELAEIKKYKDFLRVNKKPIDMEKASIPLCGRSFISDGPHSNPGAVYYINELTQQGLQEFSTKKQFPVGSIVVKEKQELRTDDSVQIITVMKKVKAGQKESSWEYKMYDVKKWEEIDYAKIAPRSFGITGCLSCHKGYKDNDYISPKGMALMLANREKGTSK